MRVLVLFVLFGIAIPASAEDVPCWLDPSIEPKVSLHASLKSLLLPIRLDEPENDAKLRFEHGDYRILANYGFTAEFTGIKDKSIICKVGVRYLEGTSDGLEGREHLQLVEKVRVYARKYNLTMLRLLKEQ